MEAVIINNLSEYNSIVSSNFNLKNKFIITTNIELICKYKNKHEFINLWKYLDNNIVNHSEKLSLQAYENFKFSEAIDLTVMNVNIFEITKMYLKYFYKGVFHSLYCLEKLIKEKQITKVYIKEKKTKPLGIVYFDKSHVLDGVAEYFFKNNNIKVKNINISETNSKSKNKEYVFTNDIFTFDEDNFKKQKSRILFLLSENFEWDFDLIRYLQRNHNNIFIVWRNARRKSNEFITNSQPLFFDDFEFKSDEQKKDIHKVINAEKEFFQRDKLHFDKFDEIFKNPYLNFQFKDYFNRLKDYVKDLHTFKRVFEFIQPDKIYFSNSWDMSVRCMVNKAKELGAKTYLSIHGGVIDNSGYTFRQTDVDNYFVWGEDNKIGLCKAGQELSSVKVVGSLQMEQWTVMLNEIQETGFYNSNSEYSQIYNNSFIKNPKKETPVVTFFASAGGGFSGHTINEYLHLESIRKIISLANKLPHISFNIKPHVLFDYYDFWEVFKNNLPENLNIINENELVKSCIELDLAILLNTISNVAYEISLTGKPLIFLKEASFITDCSESTIERGSILCINNFVELEKLILDFFTVNSLRVHLDERRKKFLDYALADFSETVCERIEKLIFGTNNNSGDFYCDFQIYEIIKWISDYVKTGKIKEYHKDINYDKIPKDNELLEWLYSVTDNWCDYYKKANSTHIYYSNILKHMKLFSNFKESNKTKKIIYAKLRSYYLNNRLNNNKYINKLVNKLKNKDVYGY